MSYSPLDGTKLIYSVDFSTLTTQNLIGGGAFTIDGKTWTAENQGAAGTFGITNGTGLVIAPGTNTTKYRDNTRSSPILQAALGQFLTTFGVSTIRALRVITKVTTTAAASDSQRMGVGFEWSITPAQFHMFGLRGRGSSQNIVGHLMATNTADASDGGTNSNDDTVCLTWRPPWMSEFRSSTFGSAFPSDGGTFRSSMSGALQANVVTQTSGGNMRIYLTAFPDASNTAFSATFTKFAIYQVL
jgi:hypothetical protein